LRREVETRVQTISKSEKAELSEDELSSKVSSQNSTDTKLGVSVEVGGGIGIVHGDAKADASHDSSQKSSQEIAHKHSRQQSAKISSEMRKDFKTTFRTTVEVQDTASKRYVLQNTTDKLVNYELRRKMRQVGVQLQHVGTRLCWQAYVDDPGARLDIPELVHIAKRGDLTGQLQPPEAPPALPRLRSSWSMLDCTVASGASCSVAAAFQPSRRITPTNASTIIRISCRAACASAS